MTDEKSSEQALRSALGRMLYRYRALLESRPVRDASETIAEAESALAAPPAAAPQQAELPEPVAFGLLSPDGKLSHDLVGTLADCEFWARAENEPQSGWAVVPIYVGPQLLAFRAQAVQEEREACALAVLGVYVMFEDTAIGDSYLQDAARAIRARSTTL